MIKAIIFDMDGVLFDSQPIHFEAEKRTVAHFGGKISDDELKGYLGWNEEAFWKDVIPKYGMDATLEQCRAFERPLLEGLLERALKPDPKLRKILKELRRSGIQLAVASSAPKKWILMTFGGLGVDDLFDCLVSGEDVEKSKPEPDIFLEAAKRIGIAPEDCIVVEDAPAGIEAAKRAGMHPIALRGTVNKGLDLSGAEREITDLSELMEIAGIFSEKPGV